MLSSITPRDTSAFGTGFPAASVTFIITVPSSLGLYEVLSVAIFTVRNFSSGNTITDLLDE